MTDISTMAPTQDTELTLEQALVEMDRCQQEYAYFSKYCRLVDTPSLTNPGGLKPFEPWPHLQQTAAHLLRDRLLVIMKTRQLGVSYEVAKYVLWFVLTHPGAHWMLFSRGEAEAIELLAKCKRIYTNLPRWLQPKTGNASATELSFPALNSKIRAWAATETAGISYTASGIVCDEHAEHPYAEQNFLAAKPAIDSCGGQFISIFTPTGWESNNFAHTLFLEAAQGLNGFIALAFNCWQRPGRDQAWWDRTYRETPETELEKLTRDQFMAKAYWRTVEEALRPLETAAAFRRRALDEMMAEVKNPLSIPEFDSKVVHIYQDYIVGGQYIAASDTGHGLGKDYSVTVLMNTRTGAIVADVLGKTLNPENLAQHSVALLGHYHNPLWYPDNDGWGRALISKAIDLRYKNFGYEDDKKTKVGFNTNGRSRDDLWFSLIPAINSHQISVFNKEGLQQFYDIIRNSKKEGRIEAQRGKHDDYPMAVGICWLKKGSVSAPFRSKVFDTIGVEETNFVMPARWI